MKVEPKQFIRRIAKNFRGYRTNRKIIVIESDDWGSIRMPSKDVYEKCLKAGYRVDKNPYERYDSLASEKDLELLFGLLSSFKNKNGNHPVFTANALPANPDFQKIREHGFTEYFYESVTDTLKSYPEHAGSMELWKEGAEQGCFHFQSHGREHLNVSEWMQALQSGDRDVLFGFELGIPGMIPKGLNHGTANKYVEALRYLNPDDKKQKLSLVVEGLSLFEELFGYRSESFIPNNYYWSPDFDETISQHGVRFYQGNRKMKEIQFDGSRLYHTYYLGYKNRFGQRYLIRNAAFEPSLFNKSEGSPVENCLKEISAAFLMNKPAIITSHRINYIGFIEESNRDRSLKLLNLLLKEIIRQWPDVEFMHSAELGKLIEGDSE